MPSDATAAHGAATNVNPTTKPAAMKAELLQGFAFVGKICSGCFHCFAFRGTKIGKFLLSLQMVFEKFAPEGWIRGHFNITKSHYYQVSKTTMLMPD